MATVTVAMATQPATTTTASLERTDLQEIDKQKSLSIRSLFPETWLWNVVIVEYVAKIISVKTLQIMEIVELHFPNFVRQTGLGKQCRPRSD